jgi:hypothetical protein
LNFSAIALIWVFNRGTEHSAAQLPADLLYPGLFVVASLALDLLQYVAASVMWGTFMRLQERRKVSEDTEFLAPPFLNWPALIAFWSKLAAVAVAYLLLLQYIVGHLFISQLAGTLTPR